MDGQRIEDEKYMRRCLQLAECGMRRAKPNPMVGAVIVAKERIIGEGFHVRCGEGHAEVNAFASVKKEDENLLGEACLYVSLEPCAHYGRTPPCAELIVRKGVRRVVVGCVDPFEKVSGKGISILRNAGIETVVGVLEDECRWLNRRFITFNVKKRPYIILKWAQSANGFLDDEFRQTTFSTPFTLMLSHKLRSESDAILVGRITQEREKPKLDVRHWFGESPMRLVLDRERPCFDGLDFSKPVLPQLMEFLYKNSVQSLLVEGGSLTHKGFIDADLWDEIRIETSPKTVIKGTPAPEIPMNASLYLRQEADGNVIERFRKRP